MFRVEHGNENSKKYFYKEFNDYDDANKYANKVERMHEGEDYWVNILTDAPEDADDYNVAYVDVFDDDGYEDNEYDESIKSYRGVPITEMAYKSTNKEHKKMANPDYLGKLMDAFEGDRQNTRIKMGNVNGDDTTKWCIKRLETLISLYEGSLKKVTGENDLFNSQGNFLQQAFNDKTGDKQHKMNAIAYGALELLNSTEELLSYLEGNDILDEDEYKEKYRIYKSLIPKDYNSHPGLYSILGSRQHKLYKANDRDNFISGQYSSIYMEIREWSQGYKMVLIANQKMSDKITDLGVNDELINYISNRYKIKVFDDDTYFSDDGYKYTFDISNWMTDNAPNKNFPILMPDGVAEDILTYITKAQKTQKV